MAKRKARSVGQVIEITPEKFTLRLYLGTDSAGKRHYHNETFHGKKTDAKARLRELIAKRQNGEPLRQSNDTLDTFLDEWLETTRPRVKESTITQYAHFLKIYVRPKLGGAMLAQVDAAAIEKLYKGMSEDARLSPATVAAVHNLLRAAFKLAVRRRKILLNPMETISAPNKGQGVRAAAAMTPEQIATFLQAAEQTRYGAFFVLAFHSGCRPGELLGLKWADFDQAARTITIQRTLNWRVEGAALASGLSTWYTTTPKTKLSKRTLPLTETLIERLHAHKREQLEDRLRAGGGWSGHDFIFCNAIGQPLKQQQIRLAFKSILRAAGLPESFKPYDCRHTTATLLMSAGTNPKVVAERLGHSNVKITLQTYSHVSPGMQAAASEEIARLISGKKG